MQVTMGSAGNPSCVCNGDATGFPGGGAVYIGADSASLRGKVIVDGSTVGSSSMCGECQRKHRRNFAVVGGNTLMV